jgi:lipopolysaccharide export system protein LptC
MADPAMTHDPPRPGPPQPGQPQPGQPQPGQPQPGQPQPGPPPLPSQARRIGPPRRASRWYSRFVATMKIVLPLTALAMVGVMLAWPQIFPAVSRLGAAIGAIGVEELSRSRMVKTRFRGVDDQGQPFSLAADVASPSPRGAELTDLENPRGDLTRSDGSWIALTAENGVYDRARRQLDLGGRVTVFHDQGYEVRTTRMHLDMATSVVQGDQAVTGQGPDTEFEAEGFRIEDRGARVFLTGQSRVVIYRQSEDGQLGLPDLPAAGAAAGTAPAAGAPQAMVPSGTPAERRLELP